MLELIPFSKKEALICIHWGQKGRWFILDQIARAVFGITGEKLRLKILYNGFKTQNTYKLVRVSDRTLIKKISGIQVIPQDTKSFYIIHLSSLDAFLKNYSRQASLFTLLYDCVHRLQYGVREEMGLSNKRKLTSADKKYVASKQHWRCAMCKHVLPSRYEVDHIIQWAKGGSDDISNLQALCPNCHADKTERDRIEEAKEDVVQHHYIRFGDEELKPSEEDGLDFGDGLDNVPTLRPEELLDSDPIEDSTIKEYVQEESILGDPIHYESYVGKLQLLPDEDSGEESNSQPSKNLGEISQIKTSFTHLPSNDSLDFVEIDSDSNDEDSIEESLSSIFASRVLQKKRKNTVDYEENKENLVNQICLPQRKKTLIR